MIEIDGTMGEGGGQVLRSALTLSILTRQPMHITNIRARRKKPGLQAQHLTAVRAAAAVGQASVDGAALDSTELIFESAAAQAGSYRFDIGTAGSTSLVLQTIYLPVALQIAQGSGARDQASAAASERTDPGSCPLPPAASEVMLIGGTHVPWSPCFHYLDLQWLPYLRHMGLDIDLELELAGFYPQGNGQVLAHIRPISRLQPLDLTERGALKGIRGLSAVANLDMSIAERQRSRALDRLQGRHSKIEIELLELPARSKGTLLLLFAEFKHTTACYFSLGAPGKRAEQVADEACLWLEKFLASSGAIDQYLADQLLLPLAFATGPSRLRTSQITEHLLTNAQVIQAFADRQCSFPPGRIEIDGKPGHPGTVRVYPAQ